MSEWFWQDFDYISGNTSTNSRRAAFLLHDFVIMFDIEQFQVIASFGEWQNQRIEILYKAPANRTVEELENLWCQHLETWKETH